MSLSFARRDVAARVLSFHEVFSAMTAHATALLDPTEAHSGPDLDPQPTETLGRHPGHPVLIVQPRHGRPAPALIDVLLAHDLDAAGAAPVGGEPLPDPAASPLAILTGSDPLHVARAGGRVE